jgi:hypothetical protein
MLYQSHKANTGPIAYFTIARPEIPSISIDNQENYHQNANVNKEQMQMFVNDLDWMFAITYANICPHEYIDKNKLDSCLQVTFEEIVNFIREVGFEVCYDSHLGKYYILDGHYYWTMGAPIRQTTIINRAKLCDYNLVENSWVWKGK